MFTIILFIYFNIIFIHKKRFRGAVPRNCSGNHKFSWHLIRGCKQILIWNIRFFSFSICPVICKLTGTSRVKSFSSCHTVFLIMRVLRSKFSANAMAWAYFLLYHHHSFREFLPFSFEEGWHHKKTFLIIIFNVN